MTGISLHKQWPLTSQSHGRSFDKFTFGFIRIKYVAPRFCHGQDLADALDVAAEVLAADVGVRRVADAAEPEKVATVAQHCQ
jgi:hypothetical protein